jgi:hypothetical protein
VLQQQVSGWFDQVHLPPVAPILVSVPHSLDQLSQARE